MADLSQVAERLHLPVGVLARLWVSERLQKELSFDISAIESWLQHRYRAIDKFIARDFCPGPIQIIHLVPFQRSLDIEPDRVSHFIRMLPPVERVDEFEARINFEGYQTVKQFKSKDKIDGTVQVFRTGQIESVRVLKSDDKDIIFADYLDDDLIRAVWSYACVLEALKIKPPIALCVGFKNMQGYRLKSRRFEAPSADINVNELQIEAITIKDWSEVITIENAARTVKKILDRVANSAGLPRSMSYSASGQWLGPPDSSAPYVQRARMTARTDVLELLGTNTSVQRNDLIMQDGADKFIVGKVRLPSLEPTAGTKFRCLVNVDEMSQGAEERLNQRHRLSMPTTFTVGDFTFTGTISRITYAPRGGPTEKTLRISPEQTMMFVVEPI
ncbi:MAG: hypothetical protein K2Y22_15845 [Candidatus Obscuribacterales bacterium]|nr:hypothetical protein [Candidatus Obscuribacterales bacterium]